MEPHFDEQANERARDDQNWTPLVRQTFVFSGLCTIYFTYGLCLGTPTVLIPQIRREANSTDYVSKEMASWLSAVFGYAALPWVILLPIFSRLLGRKIPFLFSIIATILAFIVLYFSSTLKQILISEIMQGVLAAYMYALCMITITEYLSPRYRSIFLTLKSASFFWGIWVANAIGTFFHWKNIAIFGLLCALYSLVSVFNWPESPYWLASVGRFEECAVAHRWLKGYNMESEKELAVLIDSYKDIHQGNGPGNRNKFVRLLKTLSSKEFYKANMLCFLLVTLYYVSGKIVCSVYSIDIVKKISGEDAAYKGMLTLDGVTIISMYIGSGFSKKIKRRVFLLTTTSITILFLLLLSIYLYLIRLKVLDENKYVSLLLLAAYSMVVSCGPMILLLSVAAELLPLKYRNLASCLNALYSKFVMGTIVKVSPYLFDLCGMHGAFLCYGLASLICLILIYRYLPETKDRTLNEIENLICGRDADANHKSTELMPLNTKSKIMDYGK